jgi:hypothetical protein
MIPSFMADAGNALEEPNKIPHETVSTVAAFL